MTQTQHWIKAKKEIKKLYNVCPWDNNKSDTNKKLKNDKSLNIGLVLKTSKENSTSTNVVYANSLYHNSDFSYLPTVSSSKKIHSRFQSITSDQFRRRHFEQLELETIVLKSVFESQVLKFQNKSPIRLSYYALEKSRLKNVLKPQGTITKVRNRCVISGRSSIVGTLSISRIQLRRLAGTKKIPGLLKV